MDPYNRPPGGAPPGFEETGFSTDNNDLNTVLALFGRSSEFLSTFIKEYLPELIHDGLDHLVGHFYNSIPLLNDATITVFNKLDIEYRKNPKRLISRLASVGLTGSQLDLENQSIRIFINRFSKSIKHGPIDWIRRNAAKVFDVVNSFLGSLKQVLASVAGVGAAIDVIAQIKDHLKAAST